MIWQKAAQPFPKQYLNFTALQQVFENIVGKGENAGNQHFLLFLQCFLPKWIQKSFKQHKICCLQML